MLKLDFTETEIEQRYREFMEHPSGSVKKKLHVVYLKALGLPHQDIVRIARVSGDSVTRYLNSLWRRWCAGALRNAVLFAAAAPGHTQSGISKPIRRIPSPKPHLTLKSSPASNFR